MLFPATESLLPFVYPMATEVVRREGPAARRRRDLSQAILLMPFFVAYPSSLATRTAPF
jgi:hypothetical protein